MIKSNLNEWKEFFDKYNVKYSVYEYENKITLDTDKGDGYKGFTFSIEFNNDGKYLSYGVWE